MAQQETTREQKSIVSDVTHHENAESIDGDDGTTGNEIRQEYTSSESSLKKKRAVKRAGDAEKGILKPIKLSKSDLYKPPTNEELNQLKETENLFHSSLLRMQIEELLKEVRLKEKRRNCIDAFLHEVKNVLSSIPETSVTDITDQSWLPRDVKVPFLQVPYNVKGKFCFLPPLSVKVVGSYLLDMCVKPDITVDVAITMPKEILQDKDNLNQRYHRKRALYLSHIASYLAKNELFESVKFGYMNSNHLKPVLLIKPKGKDVKLLTVRLLASAPQGFFKLGRFLPSKNNIRSAWFMEQSLSQEGVNDPPTPHYNNSILTDLVLEQHLHFLFNAATDFPGMKDGVAILKVWLRQRELDKGFGSFSGFIASMLVAYLVSKHKINKMMSGYQILRNVLQFLATTDLTENGITMAQNKDDSAPSLAEFHQAFDVVMVDPSGYVNLCAEMTASKYKQVQFEAKQSMEILDDKTTDGFQMLLMTPKPFVRTFDHVFFIKNLVKLQGTCKKMNLLNEMMDHGGNYIVAALPYIVSVLLRGLGQRVQLFSHSLIETPEWAISEDPPKHKDIKFLTFGLLLNSEFCTIVLDRGPQADNPEAVEFRTFWGQKSELRRFQDGAICEAVVWQAETMCEKRLIQEQIIQYLLELHADIPSSSLSYVGGLLDSIIKVKDEPLGTGEEESVAVIKSYDDLSRKLWNLEELPLTVTSVQGTHPALRYTDVFPPVCVKPDYACYKKTKDKSLLPLEDKPCPVYIPALTVICHMEGSGKWPQDKEAIKRIKAAFHIRLTELLNQQHQLLCRPTATHVDVYKDGYVFRIQVAYHREPLILKEVITPEGMLKYKDTDESLKLETDTIHRPYLTSTLHGLQQQFPAYSGTCRLAKRWIRAQLLGDFISEECTDLMVAFLFLHPAPHTPPSSPQVGLLRFLHLLATFDWKNNPLIVNLNGDIKDVEYPEIKNDFLTIRSQLPVLFIATPKDRKGSMWTKEQPSAQILQRLILLAFESLQTLENYLMDPLGNHDVKMVFRPPVEFYDIIIHLNPRQIPRLLEAVDKPAVSFSRGLLKNNASVKTLSMPVVDYDPVQCYLKELRDAFGDLALFFYDTHGGSLIGVLWKPQVFIPQPFKTSQVNGRTLECRNNDIVMVPNVEAIIEDFEILGDGLVKSVEARTEKWNI
ncbi:nucleolar protein 6 isoform X1 [Protopterus annectens]|uniref:nucleolar protein 6 isoform X1 n=1 Tax=Protopterus annectens TaxID=7888 RepID=UPI001CF97391|nr:nucleolar protein 6 isoform X1 [Protopterus annectens]